MSSPAEPRPSRRRATRVAALAALGAGLVLTCFSAGVWAAFSSGPVGSHGNQITAAADWVAPSAAPAVVQKSQGGTTGYIRQGGSYRVYADVDDSGNPPSGVASVSGNLTSLTTGLANAALSFGTFNVAGAGYNYASGSQTARSTLAAGSYTYSLTSADNAGNSRTQAGFEVIVDNTVPTAADIQAENHSGGTAGRAEQGDSITYTFSEPVESGSILGGWDGGARDVVVRLDDGGFFGSDRVRIFNASNSTQLALGTVTLDESGYVSANRTFGASATRSRMVLSDDAIKITLGTASGSVTTPWFPGQMRWTPSIAAYDWAGNPMSASAVDESGSSDKEF